ncbi:MAG: SPASM domain-containing protein [Clostridiales bacterium]|jgi:radical SAM protein with 4Fe4S-binding SPASM domain|nr:SPASM domain-containing protein [Clostridiales bacterium]
MNDAEKLFLTQSENKRIVVFGAGQNGKDFIDKYNSLRTIEYVVDNNAELWGCAVCGTTIKNPKELKKDFDDNKDIFTVIAIGRYYSVCLQLNLHMKIKAQIAYIDGEFIDVSEIITDRLSPMNFHNTTLRIETTNRCNLKCSFCAREQLSRDQGDIDDDLFKKIINEAASLGFRKLDLRNFGEPLLDKKLEKRIFIAKKCGFTNIFIYTNGSLLTPERYKSLSDAGLNCVIISLSPKREFELTRKRVSYERIFNNIIQIAKARKRRITEELYAASIEVHIVAPASTDDECRRTEFDLKNIGIKKIVKVHIHNWSDFTEACSCEKHTPCHRLFDSVTVLRDGKIALCCIDYDGKYILGDLAEENLADAINSDKYRAMRKAQLTGKLPSICKTCSNFR